MKLNIFVTLISVFTVTFGQSNTSLLNTSINLLVLNSSVWIYHCRVTMVLNGFLFFCNHGCSFCCSLHLTTFCLQYSPPIVACVCIHLACKWSNWEIPFPQTANTGGSMLTPRWPLSCWMVCICNWFSFEMAMFFVIERKYNARDLEKGCDGCFYVCFII